MYMYLLIKKAMKEESGQFPIEALRLYNSKHFDRVTNLTSKIAIVDAMLAS